MPDKLPVLARRTPRR